MYQKFGIKKEILDLSEEVEKEIQPIFKNIEKIEEIYAKIFNAEDALVRAQLISGTHALAVTLFGILRPGDTMLSISGAPYDTLQTAIGISKEESKSSLKAFGVKYEQIELIDNDFDINSIKEIARISSGEINEATIQYATQLRNKKAC